MAGLDTVEYAPDIYLPEVQRRPESLVEPDGTVVDAEPVDPGRRPGAERAGTR